MTDLVVTVMDSVTDLRNALVVSSSDPVTVDTLNPEVSVNDDQFGTAFDGDNSLSYMLSFSELHSRSPRLI